MLRVLGGHRRQREREDCVVGEGRPAERHRGRLRVRDVVREDDRHPAELPLAGLGVWRRRMHSYPIGIEQCPRCRAKSRRRGEWLGPDGKRRAEHARRDEAVALLVEPERRRGRATTTEDRSAILDRKAHDERFAMRHAEAIGDGVHLQRTRRRAGHGLGRRPSRRASPQGRAGSRPSRARSDRGPRSPRPRTPAVGPPCRARRGPGLYRSLRGRSACPWRTFLRVAAARTHRRSGGGASARLQSRQPPDRRRWRPRPATGAARPLVQRGPGHRLRGRRRSPSGDCNPPRARGWPSRRTRRPAQRVAQATRSDGGARA